MTRPDARESSDTGAVVFTEPATGVRREFPVGPDGHFHGTLPTSIPVTGRFTDHVAATNDDANASTETHLQYLLDVLAITAEAELVYQEAPFLWHVRDGRASFSMACSDTFAWGCADAEEIRPEDVPLLHECVAELKGAEECGEIWLGVYYCARKRGMRPMNRWFKDMREKEEMSDAVFALFCAVGPERESTWGAP